MTNEPRKATDVLLDLESKIDMLLDIVRNQDLNIKVLSNKLNSIVNNKLPSQAPKITVEAVNTTAFQPMPTPNPQVLVPADEQLKIDNNPTGFRRTSRPETYSGDNSYLPSKSSVNPKFPIQIPEAIVPKEAMIAPTKAQNQPMAQEKNVPTNSVPVQQRVVDKNGKSVFLADVEVIDLSSGDKVMKSRTNGTGKWMGSLTQGKYKVIISKREALTKERVEVVQNIVVDGKTSPLELQMLVFK